MSERSVKKTNDGEIDRAFSKLVKTSALAGVLMLGAQGAYGETFRWASTTDPQTMDPHAVNANKFSVIVSVAFNSPR